MTPPSSCLILDSPRILRFHSLPCRRRTEKRLKPVKICIDLFTCFINIYWPLGTKISFYIFGTLGCPQYLLGQKLRMLRIASLRPRVSPLPLIIRAGTYSTVPVPTKEVVTPELEKADRAKEMELRTEQAPNRNTTWASSQRSRGDAFDQPRFEGAILQMQV